MNTPPPFCPVYPTRMKPYYVKHDINGIESSFHRPPIACCRRKPKGKHARQSGKEQDQNKTTHISCQPVRRSGVMYYVCNTRKLTACRITKRNKPRHTFARILEEGSKRDRFHISRKVLNEKDMLVELLRSLVA